MTDAQTSVSEDGVVVSQSAPGGVSTSAVYDAFNRKISATDARGNATQIQTSTGTWIISYNGENRPIRFENAETQTVVECGYDSQGRRFEKKVTVAGTTTLHHRYIYRGYLQIAALDLTRSAHPALWLVTWDPTQPTATRPLAIQKDGTWFTYGYDTTKSICEVFGPAGYIRTSYSYAPFGSVSESGNVSQPLQWSSEVYDSELDLVYYNYRHYSPSLGRFLSRDPIAEQGGLNLYGFIGNKTLGKTDELGLKVYKCKRKADVICGGIAKAAGKYHEWLKMDSYESGLGNGGGVPGEDGSCPDCICSPTFIVDHSGQSSMQGSHCVELPNVCEKCADAYLSPIGTRVGSWLPFIADCNMFVSVVTERCTPYRKVLRSHVELDPRSSYPTFIIYRVVVDEWSKDLFIHYPDGERVLK